jgi:hypothetical protein
LAETFGELVCFEDSVVKAARIALQVLFRVFCHIAQEISEPLLDPPAFLQRLVRVVDIVIVIVFVGLWFGRSAPVARAFSCRGASTFAL